MGKKLSHQEASKIMLEAGAKPLEQYPGNNKPWHCECLVCEKEIFPHRSAVKNGQGACGYCARRLVDPADAEKSMRGAGAIPLESYKNARIPWKCQCAKCGELISPRYDDVRSGQNPCKYCSGTVVDIKKAELYLKKIGVHPVGPYTGDNDIWPCICENCGKQVNRAWRNLKKSKIGCRSCAGNLVDPEEARQVMIAAGALPLTQYYEPNKKWSCKCLTCRRNIEPTYTNVRRGRGVCVYCAGRKVDEKEVISRMHDTDLEPLVPYPGANVPWLCKCLNCGEQVRPRWTSIKSGQGGCSNCATYGFNDAGPAVLYFLHNGELNLYKIGISKRESTDIRLRKHTNKGWDILHLWNFEIGSIARKIEKGVLMQWKSQNALAIGDEYKEAMHQGGWTEVANDSNIDPKSVIDYVDFLQITHTEET